MRVLRSSLALVAVASACVAGAETRRLGQQSTNLEDAPQFFVCGSRVDGMDGKFVIQSDDASTRSDSDAPVYFREDDDGDADEHAQRDFRLFRHRGFWMFADVGAWPPETHFRCDPTKRELVSPTLDVAAVCQANLPTPPRVGYSPARPGHSVPHLVLSAAACSSVSTLPTLEPPDEALQAPATLSSRTSEL